MYHVMRLLMGDVTFSMLPSAVTRLNTPAAAAVRSSAPPPPPYLRSATRRVQKQLEGHVTWKCIALLLVCLTAFLVALVSYLAGK